MTTLEQELEAFIDEHGIRSVVMSLAHICHRKSISTRENDPGSSMTWARQGKVLDNTVDRL